MRPNPGQAPPPPPTAGAYELLGELGRGGFGVVYRARERATGREVALKVLLGRPHPERLERFRREGQVTASLDHPGIVRVHAAGDLNGRPYLAYELVEGARPLHEVLPTLDLKARVGLVRDAARALGAAHRRGLVHRDVKGDNLLVDPAGRLRVADFGLAAGASLERLTRTGALVGTPHFMAPELLDTARGRAGAPADVWALGVVLYQALTGALPFDGHGVAEVLGRAATADVRRPRQLAPAVPRSLEAVCLRALERDPARRYPDGEALADDLDAWLEGRRVSASSALLPVARVRSRWAVAGLLGAAAVAAAVAWTGPVPGAASGAARPGSTSPTVEPPTPGPTTPATPPPSEPSPDQAAPEDAGADPGRPAWWPDHLRHPSGPSDLSPAQRAVLDRFTGVGMTGLAAYRLLDSLPDGDELSDDERAVLYLHLLEEALAQDPDSAGAHYSLGRLLQDLGDREAAAPHLRAAAAGGDPNGLNYAAGRATEADPPDWARARELYARLIHDRDNGFRARARLAMALSLGLGGPSDPERALDLLEGIDPAHLEVKELPTHEVAAIEAFLLAEGGRAAAALEVWAAVHEEGDAADTPPWRRAHAEELRRAASEARD